MNTNLLNLINEYQNLSQFRPSSTEEFKDLAIKIQSLSQLLKLHFKDETVDFLSGTEFLENFNEAIALISNEECNNFIKNIPKKNYSAEDIVLLLDSNLTTEQNLLAIILCSDIEYYLKLNTYLMRP